MTDIPAPTRPSMAALAAESPEESVDEERAATEDEPDVGDTVPEGDSH